MGAVQIGSQLLATLESEANKNVDFLQVKTVAEGSNKDYDRTNIFYRSLGFKKLEIFPQLWGPQNPCQILIKILRKSSHNKTHSIKVQHCTDPKKLDN